MKHFAEYKKAHSIMKRVNKLVSLALALAMCLTLAVSAMAAEIPPDSHSLFEMNRETTDLKVYQAAMAEYVESQRDVLQAEIEAYQLTASNMRTATYYYGGFGYQAGDILVTSDTVIDGMLGHAGIVIQNSSGAFKILEITPNEYNNANKHPTAVSFSMWYGEYSNTYVLRSSSNGAAAANYGNSYYVDGAGKNITYSFVSNLYGTGNTYCSALVWRCFYYGSGQALTVSGTGPVGGVQVVPSFYLPYDFITFRSYNNLSAVHSVNW